MNPEAQPEHVGTPSGVTAAASVAPHARRGHRTSEELDFYDDRGHGQEAAEDAGHRVQEMYEAEEPAVLVVDRDDWWGCVGVSHNLPYPGRDARLLKFERAVADAGGLVKARVGSGGAARPDRYPHRLLGVPDGDGWAVYYMIACLSEGEVRGLAEEHLGEVDGPRTGGEGTDS